MIDRRGVEVSGGTKARERRLRHFVGPALGVGLGAVGALRGHTLFGLTTMVTSALLALSMWSSDAVLERTRAIERALAEKFGTVVAAVVLVPIHVLIITPVGLVLRLIGRSPLRDAVGREGSYWTLRTSGAHDTHRMFGDETFWRHGSRSRSRAEVRQGGGRRVAVAIVLLALLGAGTALAALNLLSADVEDLGDAGYRDGVLPNPSQAAALAGDEWAPDAYREMAEVTSGLVYVPFIGSAVRDYRGEYVNVSNRVRKSYEAAETDPDAVVDVWFFGGSTMFGFDLQRDLHTIPSEFVRRAEAAGISVRARNYGAPGLVNYQETMLLLQLVSAGERPEVVVFYDGINDVTLGLMRSLGIESMPAQPSDLSAHRVRSLVADLVPGGDARPPGPLADGDPPQGLSVDGIVENTLVVYEQGIEIAEMIKVHHGFDVLHFWQPDLYSKQPLDPGEEKLKAGLRLGDPRRFETVSSIQRAVRERLPPGVVDISDALDGVDGPVLTDVVHSNEQGARAVAAAMFHELEPLLRATSCARTGC